MGAPMLRSLRYLTADRLPADDYDDVSDLRCKYNTFSTWKLAEFRSASSACSAARAHQGPMTS